MVGVYLTNYTTELSFRQFIGRIARNQGTEFDREAYVHYPHHPRLNSYAENIQRLQAIAIERRNKATDDIPLDGNGTRPPSSLVYLGGSDAEAAGLILPGLGTDPACGPEIARTISDFARRYRIPETTAALIMRNQGQLGATARPLRPEADGRANEKPLEDRLDVERKRQHRLIGRWAKLVRGDYRALNNEANKHAGCMSVEVATEEQLKRRHDFIEQKIRDGRVN
jgi:hypothetical protein